MKIDWKRKLTSRKFWLSVASFVAMLLFCFGEDASWIERITSLIMAGGTVIAYTLGEGMTDKASLEGKE